MIEVDHVTKRFGSVVALDDVSFTVRPGHVTGFLGPNGAEYPVLAVGILGVLSFTSEYGTGQIRTTFVAVPQRLVVLAAKAVVTGVAVLVLGGVLAFVSFLATDAVLSGHPAATSLAGPTVPVEVAAAGFCLLAVAMAGVGLGAIIRHTVGAVAALPALFYLPLSLLSLPSPWNDRISRFTLPMAAYQVVSLHPHPGLLSRWESMMVLTAWPAALLIIAALVVDRRDA